eukprot:1193773-Lingulodinium_polyedra.AAC.1
MPMPVRPRECGGRPRRSPAPWPGGPAEGATATAVVAARDRLSPDRLKNLDASINVSTNTRIKK